MDERELRREQALQRARAQANVGRAPHVRPRGADRGPRTTPSGPAPSAASRSSLTKNRRLRPTMRGLGTLVIGVIALLFAYSAGRQEFVVVAAAALLLALGGLLMNRIRQPRLDVTRRFSPPVVSAGSTVQVALRLRNMGAGPTPHLVWNDAIPWPESAAPNELPPIGSGTAPRVRATAGERGVVTAHYELHPQRRGLYQVGPLVVEHEDPFGMARSTMALGLADRLVVVPEVVELGPGGPALANGEGTAQLVQRQITGNDDDLTTREYRTGDALRRIHWRASARRGELMVRQEEHRSHPDARIVLDTRRAGYADVVVDESDPRHPVSASEAFEWSVRMLASLGVHLDGSGFQVSVEETAAAQIVQLGERWDGRRREGFLTSLAGVSLVDAGTTRPPRTSAQQPSGPVFALLGDPEDLTVDWLIHHRRAGDAAIAFLVEPRSQVLRRLGDAGWLCVPVQAWQDPAAAWQGVSRTAPLEWSRRA
ncbi:MAG TPA: DUF58 domain-containing protein [Pseudolysinimonas sp.]|nr:DUF58 domain-containing protein [Pseudolysinimonas sp.]